MRTHWSDRDRLWEMDRERELRDKRDGRHSRYDRDRPGAPRDPYLKDSRYDLYSKDRSSDYPPPPKRREYGVPSSTEREKYRSSRDEHDIASTSTVVKPTDSRAGLSSEHPTHSKSLSGRSSEHSPSNSVSFDRNAPSSRKELTSRSQPGSDDLFPHLLGENGEPAKKREPETKRQVNQPPASQTPVSSKQAEKPRPKTPSARSSASTSPALSTQRTSSLPGSLESTASSSLSSTLSSSNTTAVEPCRSKSTPSSSSKPNLHEVLKNSIAKPVPIKSEKSAASTSSADTLIGVSDSKPKLQSDIFSHPKAHINHKPELPELSPINTSRTKEVAEKKTNVSQSSPSAIRNGSMTDTNRKQDNKEKPKHISSENLNNANDLKPVLAEKEGKTKTPQSISSKVSPTLSETAQVKSTTIPDATSETKISKKAQPASTVSTGLATKASTPSSASKSKSISKPLSKSAESIGEVPVPKSPSTISKASKEAPKNELKIDPKNRRKPVAESGTITGSKLKSIDRKGPELNADTSAKSKVESKTETAVRLNLQSKTEVTIKSTPESTAEHTPGSKTLDTNKPTPRSESESDIAAKPKVSSKPLNISSSKVESTTEITSKSSPEVEADTSGKAKNYMKIREDSKDEPKVGLTFKSKLETGFQSKHQLNSKSESQTKSESRLELKSGSKPEPTPASKPESTPMSKPESTPVSKPESTPVSKPGSKPEPKPESKSESRPESKLESKSESKPESKSEPKPESKPEPKPESSSGPSVELNIETGSKPVDTPLREPKSAVKGIITDSSLEGLKKDAKVDATETAFQIVNSADKQQASPTSVSNQLNHIVSEVATKDKVHNNLDVTKTAKDAKPEPTFLNAQLVKSGNKSLTETESKLANANDEKDVTSHGNVQVTDTPELSEKDRELLRRTATIPPLEKLPLKTVKDEEDLPLAFPLNKLEQGIHDIQQLSESELHANMKYIPAKPIKSLEEYPFYLQNQKTNDFKVCKVLFNQISKHKKQLHEDSLVYQQRFKKLKTSWLRYCKASENSHNLTFFNQDNDALLADSNGSGSSRRSRNHGDSVRSEAEYMEILANLERESARDPSVRAKLTSAVVPSLIFDPIERDEIRYIDTNNFVADKSIPYKRLMSDNVDNFTPEEHEAFCEAYVLSPKQFGKISKVMGGRRSFNDCVLHYYQTKKQVDYKSLLLNRNRRTTRKGRKKAQKEKEKAIARNAAELALATEEPKQEVSSEPAVKIEVNGTVPVVSAKAADDSEKKRQAPDVDSPAESTRKRVKKTRGAVAKALKEKKKAEESETNDTNSPLPETSDAPSSSQQKSYWSVSENNLFQQLLLSYGSNWAKIAKHFKTKSYVMVKNHCSKNQEWIKLAAETDEKIAKGIPVPAPPDTIDLDVRKRKPHGDSSQSRGNSAVSTPVQRPVTPSNLNDDLRLNTLPVQQPSSAEAALRNALDKRYINRTSSPSTYQQPQTQSVHSRTQSQSQLFQHNQPQPQHIQEQAVPFAPSRPAHSSIQSLLQTSDESNYSKPLSIASLSGNSRTLPVPPALSRSSSPQNQIKPLPKLTEHQPSAMLTQGYNMENKTSFSYNGITATASNISSLPSARPMESITRPGYYLPGQNLPAGANSGYYLPQQQEKEQANKKQENQVSYYSQTYDPISGEIKGGLSHQRTASSGSRGMALSNITDMPARSYNSSTVSTNTSPYAPLPSTYSAPKSRPNSLSSLLNPVSSNESRPASASLTPVQPAATPISQPGRTGWYDAARESITPAAPPVASSFTQNSKGQVLLPSLTGITPNASRPFSTMFSDQTRGAGSSSAESSAASTLVGKSSSVLGSPYNPEQPSNRSGYLSLPSLSGHPNFGSSSTGPSILNTVSSTPSSVYPSSITGQQPTFNSYNHMRAPDQAVDQVTQHSSFFSNTRSTLPLSNPGQPAASTNPPYGSYDYMSKESNERGLPPPSSLNSHQRR